MAGSGFLILGVVVVVCLSAWGASAETLYSERELSGDIEGGRVCINDLRTWLTNRMKAGPVRPTEDLRVDMETPVAYKIVTKASKNKLKLIGGLPVPPKPSKTASTCVNYVDRAMRIWGLEDQSITLEIDDPNHHISEATDCILQSHTHTLFACEIAQSIRVTDQLKDVAAESVCHAVFIDALVKLIQSNFDQAERMFDAIFERLRTYSYFSMRVPFTKKFELLFVKHSEIFGGVKLNTMFSGLKGVLAAMKTKISNEDKKLCDSRMNMVSINVIEATITDFMDKRYQNVPAGLVLAAVPSVNERVPAIETEPEYYTDVDFRVFQPFPAEWADLYGLWNMAFVAGEFNDWPKFWAKLLNVQTICHRRRKGSYIFYRAITLVIHIIHEALTRNVRGNARPPFDLRQRSFSDTLGIGTRVAATTYLAKVLATDEERATSGGGRGWMATYESAERGMRALSQLMTGGAKWYNNIVSRSIPLVRYIAPTLKACTIGVLRSAKSFGAQLAGAVGLRVSSTLKAIKSAMSSMVSYIYNAATSAAAAVVGLDGAAAGAPAPPSEMPDGEFQEIMVAYARDELIDDSQAVAPESSSSAPPPLPSSAPPPLPESSSSSSSSLPSPPPQQEMLPLPSAGKKRNGLETVGRH